MQGEPWDYDHRRNVWTYWDWKSESTVVGWVGPTREIKVYCEFFEGDDPCKYDYVLLLYSSKILFLIVAKIHR